MSIKITNNIQKIIKTLKAKGEDYSNALGVTGVAKIQSNTPVDTGTLKRSITFKAAKKGTKYSITYGTSVDYSIYVEFKGKSAGYLRNSLADFRSEAIRIIQKSLKEL